MTLTQRLIWKSHCNLLFLGHMLDLLRTQGKNGGMALLESLMIHYPALYTQVTGRKPSTEPSRFSGEWLKVLVCLMDVFVLFVLLTAILALSFRPDKILRAD